MSVVAAILVVLRLLEVVFGLVTENCASNGTDNAVAAHLVAAKVSSSTATEGAHKATVTLLLHSWVAGAILLLLPRLPVGVLALWVLILAIRTLLRELVVRLLAGVTSLLLLAILPLLRLIVVAVLAYLLAVLEAALRRRAVLRVVALLLPISLLAVLLLGLLVALLLVTALVISTLLRVWAVPLGWVLLLLAVALVVLIVARHICCV